MKLLITLVYIGLALFSEIDDISKLLKHHKNSRDLKEFLSSFGPPEDVYKSNDSYYESFHNAGISFCFDYNDKLLAIFVYSKLSDKYKEYKGKLPLNLNFDLSRSDIEARFGLPDYKGNMTSNNTSWVVYKEEGFGITYNGLSEIDTAKIVEYNFQ